VTFRLTTRGGRYLRVADPDWADPFDAEPARRQGGRWNAPESFGVVYLNRDERTARLNVMRLFAGLPYGPEDLDPREAPDLVETHVPDTEFLDAVSRDGLVAAGLPESYPDDETGARVTHVVTQPIGQAAWDQGLAGVACRSAAPGASAEQEELAWFDRGGPRLTASARRPFDDWF
jgi:RES domain